MSLSVAAPAACAQCGTQLAPSLLACPGCRALVHADALKRLAGAAREAEAAGDHPSALLRWREALELLPSSTRQHAAIVERVSALSAGDGDGTRARRRAEEERVRARFGRYGAGVGAVAVFLLKFKFLLLLLLTKGKLLLLGLTKLSTLSSMALFLGFDATFLGWPLALGLVLSIYVHEMGHVAALRRHGIRATSPMFLPGVGAFIRAQQRLHGEWAEADVGLAGPLWGLGAAVVALAAFGVTGRAYWATLARWGALINVFNLLPVWQLDGAHAFRAMSRPHRIAAVLATLAALVVTRERMLVLVLAGAAWGAFQRPAERPDVRAVTLYALLVAALGAIAALGGHLVAAN